jgi:hypothetical protein
LSFEPLLIHFHGAIRIRSLAEGVPDYHIEILLVLIIEAIDLFLHVMHLLFKCGDLPLQSQEVFLIIVLLERKFAYLVIFLLQNKIMAVNLNLHGPKVIL